VSSRAYQAFYDADLYVVEMGLELEVERARADLIRAAETAVDEDIDGAATLLARACRLLAEVKDVIAKASADDDTAGGGQ
jgi:hypothetical protein